MLNLSEKRIYECGDRFSVNTVGKEKGKMIFIKDRKIVIFVPRKLVRDELENNKIRPGILLAYCWLIRFGTIDGYSSDSLLNISKKMGLHYNKAKDRHIPNLMKLFKDGLKYLAANDILSIEGDINNFEETLKFKIDVWVEKGESYIPLDLNYFEYVLNFKGKAHKANLLYVLLYVLSCYTYIDGKTYCACSYSTIKMSNDLGINRVTLFNYLSYLSRDTETVNDKPLKKSAPIHITLDNGQVIRLPNIYVINNNNADMILRYQKKFIISSFKTHQSADSEDFSRMVDYDDLF